MTLKQIFDPARSLHLGWDVGLAISIPIALRTSKFLQSLVFNLKDNDPGTLVLAVGILLAAALADGCLPARRASRIDPMTALRHESWTTGTPPSLSFAII